MSTIASKYTKSVIQRFLLGMFAFLLITSCGANSLHSETPADGINSFPSSPTSNCRVVQHAMGETCVPLNPQRVVTIDPFSLENVLALGMQPVGVAISSDWLEKRDYLRNRLSGVEIVGNHNQPNLEKILTVNPDLILGLELESEAAYRQLAQIAPTVLLNFETSGQWKDILMNNAVALGKTDVAKQVMAKYVARLDEFKSEVKPSADSTGNDQALKVSIIRISPNTISIYTKNTFIGTIIEDAGLARPPAQNQTDNLEISKESLSIANGDVIFLWSNETGQAQKETQTKIAKVTDDPLWQQLNAVQQGKVYQVPSYWIGSSILTAHAVIDDLFRYLVATQ